uniref:Uncharacterized protein n=1 Tax=Glossina austeni TaxID=7395 RepID=A0A1A9VP73_GLOAU
MEPDNYRSDSLLTICFNWLTDWLIPFTFNAGVKVLSGIEHWRVLILFLTFLIGLKMKFTDGNSTNFIFIFFTSETGTRTDESATYQSSIQIQACSKPTAYVQLKCNRHCARKLGGLSWDCRSETYKTVRKDISHKWLSICRKGIKQWCNSLFSRNHNRLQYELVASQVLIAPAVDLLSGYLRFSLNGSQGSRQSRGGEV